MMKIRLKKRLKKKEENAEEEEEEDYYSEEGINYRKQLRRSLYPKEKKPYYPPYD